MAQVAVQEAKNNFARRSSSGLDNVSSQFALSWNDLTYTVQPRSGEPKTLLTSVSGHILPGEMAAFMGPSGSGKTTLLDLLADRISSGKVEGTILLGNCPRDANSSRKVISYVMQEDSLLTCFTVRETLRYAARLSLGNIDQEKREKRVNSVIEEMGLSVCADTRVGDILIKGLSGGQKRRLSIAVELLAGSPVLLLDEPTSGLDSFSAFQVVEHLKTIASKGHTVAMSIHQPSSATFAMFSKVVLLTRGKLVYFGALGQVAFDHFASAGHPIPAYTNPADFFLDVVSTDFKPEREGDVKALVDFYKDSPAAQEDKRIRSDGLQKNPPSECQSSSKGAGPVLQFCVLLVRMLHMSYKNPYIWAVRIVMYVALSFMVGTMYLNVGETARNDSGPEGRAAAESLLPLLFYVQAFLVFMSVAVLPFFLEQRDAFRRERSNGLITCAPYVAADFLSGLPCIAIIAVVSSLLVVLFADLNGFGGFFLNLFLSLVAAEALMHLIGAAQPHYIIGMAGGAGLFGMFMLCEGFMVRPDDIPPGWMWGYYIAMHTYSFEWFMYNQFHGADGGAYGEGILKHYDMEDVDPTRNALILLGYAALFEVGFFLVLKIIHTGRR